MNLKIAKLPGDGIGPEVVEQAVKAVDAVCEKAGHKAEYTFGYVGACAIRKFGDAFPEETFRTCMDSDAVLFGAVGDPEFDNNPTAKVRPEQGLLAMRKKLGLYANLRPVETFSALVHKSPLRKELVDGADFLCVRELTGGMYFGEKGRKDNGDTAWDTNIYHRYEVERILRLAFDYARLRRRHLTVVDKANVLESSRLWRQIAQELAPEYPDVTTDYMYVDNAAMQLVRNPQQFDVIVTSNMFGDILSDEASQLTGSIGMLASASMGDSSRGMYEPIHGSAPDIAGQNNANPIVTILSAAMMLRYAFGLSAEAQCIEDAIDAVLAAGFRTADILGNSKTDICSGSDMTGKILNAIG